MIEIALIEGEIYDGADFIPDCPPGTHFDPDTKVGKSFINQCQC